MDKKKKITKQSFKTMALKESKNHELVRSKERQSEYGEVFTPTELVLDILKKLPKSSWEYGKDFLDPSCGNGQFLAVVALVKKHKGHKKVLETIYGVDILQDNVQECRKRLLDIVGDTPYNRTIVERNIVCHDALTYDYSFGRNQDEVLDVRYIPEALGKDGKCLHYNGLNWPCSKYNDKNTLKIIAERECVSSIDVYSEKTGKLIYEYRE